MKISKHELGENFGNTFRVEDFTIDGIATFSDFFTPLTGAWKYLLVVAFAALLAASVAIAVRNWIEDPAQRTGTHLAIWLMRVLVGCMWFQGMLWKLPFSPRRYRRLVGTL